VTKQQQLRERLLIPCPVSCFDKISGQVNQIESLIADLLKLSRAGKSPEHVIKINLEYLTKKVFSSIKPENCVVELIISPDLPDIIGDLAGIERVFENIFNNAIQSKDPEEEKPVIKLGTRKAMGKTVICVEDNGVGINPDYLERIFNPRFSHGKAGINGLGLSITRRIIEAHGGRIWAKSAGKKLGAEFLLELPLAQKSINLSRPD